MNILKSTDNTRDAIIKMSKGNIGALSLLCDMKSSGDHGFEDYLVLLDSIELYGTDIYILWNDKCKRNNKKFAMLLRAVNFSYISNERLKELAKDQMNATSITDEEWDIITKECDDEYISNYYV